MSNQLPWTPLIAFGGLVMGLAVGLYFQPWAPAEPDEAPTVPIGPAVVGPSMVADTDPPPPAGPREPRLLVELRKAPALDATLWDEAAAALRSVLPGVPVVCEGGPGLPGDPTLTRGDTDLLPTLATPTSLRFVAPGGTGRMSLPQGDPHPEVVLDLDGRGGCRVLAVPRLEASGQVVRADGAPMPEARLTLCGHPVRVDETGHFAADVARDATSVRQEQPACSAALDGHTLSPASVKDGARGLVLTAETGEAPPSEVPSTALPVLATADATAALDRAARAMLDPERSQPVRAWLRSRIAVVSKAHGLPDPVAGLADAGPAYDASADDLIGLLDRGPDPDTDPE